MTRPAELTAEQEERLARWRAGEMSAEERAAFERDVLASDALFEAAYREAGFDALARRDARPAAVPVRARRWRRIVAYASLPVAAALLAVWLLPRGRAPQGEGPDVMRGSEGAVRLVAPAGELGAPPARFTWTRDPGAESYRVEVFDEGGTRVGTSVTRDTTLEASALGAPVPAAGEWRVVPVAPDGAERAASERGTWRTH